MIAKRIQVRPGSQLCMCSLIIFSSSSVIFFHVNHLGGFPSVLKFESELDKVFNDYQPRFLRGSLFSVSTEFSIQRILF